MCNNMGINYQAGITIVSVLIICSHNPGTAQVPLDKFFPFGLPNEDSVLTPCLRCHSVDIPLKFPVHFFGTSYSTVYVNNRGSISFESVTHTLPRPCNSTSEPRISNTPLLAPLWSDIDTNHGGHIYFRESTNLTLISRADGEIRKAFPELESELKSIFIATWDKVAPYLEYPCQDEKLRNTFQAAILTTTDENEIKTFVIFYYNEIKWTNPSQYVNSKCVQNEGIPSAAGFTAGGSGQTFYNFLGNCTDSVLNLVNKSNVGQPGKWVFRVDTGFQHASVFSRASVFLSVSIVSRVLYCVLAALIVYSSSYSIVFFHHE